MRTAGMMSIAMTGGAEASIQLFAVHRDRLIEIKRRGRQRHSLEKSTGHGDSDGSQSAEREVGAAPFMIKLEKRDYQIAADALKRVAINNLFARSVIENHVDGIVYADRPRDPSTFYVVHPYGMSLLFGESGNAVFNAAFRDYCLNASKTRDRHEWMQAFPTRWHDVLDELFLGYIISSAGNPGNPDIGRVELNTRLNFRFNAARFRDLRKSSDARGATIVRTDERLFNAMKGSVVPSSSWNNASDFCTNGIGFSLLHEGALACTAYSAYIHGRQLEIGIETLEAFRGKGLAQRTCAALIDYCLENDYEPVWSCRLENTASCRLAEKLGFEVSARIPYYRLPSRDSCGGWLAASRAT